MFHRPFLLLLALGLSGLPVAMAQDHVVAEVFAYPFEPVSARTVHYRLMSNGEGQMAIVSPEGVVESTQPLMRLSEDRTRAMLEAIQRIKATTLRRAPKKDPDQCATGGAEFSVTNSQGETHPIAKVENCESYEGVQPEAQLIELLLRSLQGISWLL